MSPSPAPFRFGSGEGSSALTDAGRFSFDFSGTSPSTSASSAIGTWTRNEYRKLYCNARGKRTIPVDVESLKRELQKKRPTDSTKIEEVIQRLDKEIAEDICKEFPSDESGAFKDYAAVIVKVNQMRPDLAKKMVVGQIVDEIEQQNIADIERKKSLSSPKQALTPIFSQELHLSSRSHSEFNASDTSSAGTDNTSPLKKVHVEAMEGNPSKKAQPKRMSSAEAESWVAEEYRKRYCDAAGNVLKIPPFADFRTELSNLRPGHSEVIAKMLKRLDDELAAKPLTQQQQAGLFALAQIECDKLSWTRETCHLNRAIVVTGLSIKRPDIHRKRLEEVVIKAEAVQDNSARQAMAKASITPVTKTATTKPSAQKVTASEPRGTGPTLPGNNMAKNFDLSSGRGQDEWAHWHYLHHGFDSDGTFKSYKWLKTYLISISPNAIMRDRVPRIVNRLRERGHQYSFPNPDKMSKSIKAKNGSAMRAKHAEEKKNAAWDDEASSKSKFPGSFPAEAPMSTMPGSPALPYIGGVSGASSSNPSDPTLVTPKDDLLARKLKQIHISKEPAGEEPAQTVLGDSDSDSDIEDHDSGVDVPSPQNEDESEDDSAVRPVNAPERVDHDDMNLLLSDESDDDDDDDEQRSTADDNQVQHAPLFDASMLSDEMKHLLPQYGLIGSHNEAGFARSKLFLNTNVPFSAFICGVQGSGKSHTTSCVLENALIPSKNLGHLHNPLSALVFSYGHFSGDGAGYSISEAAFLAAPHPKLPGGAHVKKVNVLVSPSNFVRISKLYQRIPNVTVTSFKLKPWNLDIDIMLTLMNVDESDDTPLYMAQVTEILRRMAEAGGPFNYPAFKQELKQQNFNPVQTTMLQMRLNLLESFLDMNNSCPEPQFRPGEITIMDMSCPFVDANTACTLFKIGLQRYLQSDATGKMVVLDEAHKYMIKVPGAKALNETLLQTIRLQRHYGARVVISTQEPTLLTDLIALCSITVIHRFSSPEWFAAAKRHIPIAAEERDGLMRRIEGLKTGSAFVYSSNAVLGWDNDGELIKGTGRMMKVSIRKRITSDGGQSVLAV